jgi:RNA polymerase subunit RPABC4/transcription elongation factor Spt4
MIGTQYCDECHTFMRRLGGGGTCPNCSEPVTIDELLDT